MGFLHNSASSQPGQPVRLPGDRAAQLEGEQRRGGILVPAPLTGRLTALAEELGIEDRLRGPVP